MTTAIDTASTSRVQRTALARPVRTVSRPLTSQTNSRRHSLYGIEDRVVIDPGGRMWKAGFSGEPDPRAVFWAALDLGRIGASEMWDLDLAAVRGARGSRAEARRLVAARISRKLRDVFHR